MSTITAILEASPDGTLHVPVPEELRHAKFKVVATAEEETAVPQPDADVDESERERQQRIIDILEELCKSNPFKGIDPVEWQREMREDVKLPWDELYGEDNETAGQ